jgi:hypothetical protein
MVMASTKPRANERGSAKRSTDAKARARAIYLELANANKGVAPSYRTVRDQLAREGMERAVSLVSRWGKDDAWEKAIRPAIQPVLQHYEVAGHDVTFEMHPNMADTKALGDAHRSTHLKARQLFNDWLDGRDTKELTTEQAFKLFEMLGKDRETAETCDLRLQQFKIMAARELSEAEGVNGNVRGHTIEHDNISLPKATEAQIERSRIAGEQARKLLADAQ